MTDNPNSCPEPSGEFSCTIDNACAVPLKVKSYNLVYGKWHNDQPPVDIPAKTQKLAFRTTGRPNSPHGTEGTVVYQMGDDADAWVSIDWDVPWVTSKSTLKIRTSDPGLATNVSGWLGTGGREAIVLTVQDQRGT